MILFDDCNYVNPNLPISSEVKEQGEADTP